jgi:hypothetical protein
MLSTQFRDVQAVGQPLSQLVIGTARPPAVPRDEQNSYQTEAHRTTQDLVRSGDDTLEGLVRLSGAIAREGSGAANSLAEDDYDDISDEDSPAFFGALPIGSSEGSTLPIHILPADHAAVDLGERAADNSAPSSLSPNLTDAFANISTAGVRNFTLTWWATADLSTPPETEQTRESISFSDISTGTPRLTVLSMSPTVDDSNLNAYVPHCYTCISFFDHKMLMNYNPLYQAFALHIIVLKCAPL